MSEKTLILIKPDGVKRGLVGEILRRIEAKGYEIAELKMLQATDELLAAHYAEHVEKPFYPEMAEYMQSGAIAAAIIAGTRVIEGVRALAGATDPTSALPGTIRGDLARAWDQGAIQNLIHSSDSVDSAQREIAIWFK
ncbi:nucleoside-diphosphate kinase [Arcanobacterium hippocoleae]